MVSKKILGVAIAAAMFSGSAFAVTNIDTTAASAYPAEKYAKETILSSDKTTVSGVDYYTITSGADADLDVSAPISKAMVTNDVAYVRVSLSKGIFKADPSWTLANTTGAIQQGGNGFSYVIFKVTATGAVTQTATPVIGITSLGLTTSLDPVSVTFSAHETFTGASTSKDAWYTKTSAAELVSVVSGLKQSFAAGTATADVEQAFKKFTNTTTPVGKIDLTVDTSTVNRVGVTTTLADIASAAAVKITGDFTLTAANTYTLNAAADCSGASTNLTVDTSKTFATSTFATVTARPYFCIVSDGSKVIPESSYSATVTYTAVTNAVWAPAVFSGKVGDVVRNGTTIQVPYITTFEGYTQRLVLVNRGAADVTYAVTFTPETGVTAAAGAKATGTLKANSTTIIPSVDLVTLTGASRTAATVAIVSAQANIDAATTIVNAGDKSTDTVKLK
ncbi:hypothetical protein GCM10011613_29120 [Cellvibrio zantedeschiae]|uniref:Surface layer protein n=1 Tax=Cellvibrio zantedeschiae TaxID=1237077 RepID=A0ABQ3BBI5_9GAMM|nr:hypothetical protein [Cellvibrio zantedeschiae]GGY82495.1 hypothetical protein GCM10011613_29120 [Cellvibrio zantedeschiae]